jgi:exodeoxyribonuclease VII small subunit
VADPTEHATPATSAADLPTTYEAAREELVDVVRRLESGGVTLEESLALWERGEVLAALCQQWLDGARARLDAAVAGTQRGAGTPPQVG